MLENVRKVAEEQGVSQQAIYFKNTADEHDAAAARWRGYTILTSIGLGAFAILVLATYKLPFLAATNPYDTAQLAIGKVLVFAVAGYMVVLFARNFLANRHNAVVNRHRQNALVTFQALTDAAGDGQKDIVLGHAAACIFSPQETGFARAHASTPQTLIELLPRLAAAAPHGGNA